MALALSIFFHKAQYRDFDWDWMTTLPFTSFDGVEARPTGDRQIASLIFPAPPLNQLDIAMSGYYRQLGLGVGKVRPVYFTVFFVMNAAAHG